ncbi:MAG: PIG-L deacetylase family protein [Terriglobales bacterium]
MINVSLSGRDDRPLQVLCLGCHSDDIEIGCGGTILRLAQQHPGSRFHWVVFSAVGVRQAEAQRAANMFVGHANLQGPMLMSFQDSFMPFTGAEIKKVFEDLKPTVSPDLILTHFRNDAHQDHRLIAELTWNTFRDHLILEYEIPKYDGDLGQPNCYVPLSAELCEKKVHYLMDAFPSQRTKRWFEESTFLALMRLRGIECNAPSGYAEAFYLRKLVW